MRIAVVVAVLVHFASAAFHTMEFTGAATDCPVDTARFPTCQTSWHCIDDAANIVQGTAGHFVMFSGALSGLVAAVDWMAGDGRKGAATITYTSGFTGAATVAPVSGDAVPSIFANSFTGGVAAAASIDKGVNCLWSTPDLSDGIMGEFEFGSASGETHCNFVDTLLGSYKQTYDDGTVETGIITATVGLNGQAFGGQWASTSGPFYPSNGTQIEKVDTGVVPPIAHEMYVSFEDGKRVDNGVQKFAAVHDGAPLGARQCLRRSEDAFRGDLPLAKKDFDYWRGAAAGLGVATGVLGIVTIVAVLTMCYLSKRKPAKQVGSSYGAQPASA